MSQLNLIAIDGPSGVGKSTTAKRLAQALGWDYLDTGAMYRATALALRRADVSLDDVSREGGSALESVLSGLRIEQRGSRFFLAGEDISEAIRTPEITRMVSGVSANARVREVLVEQQRAIGRTGKGWVVDGRDIGTVVFPDAATKIFLTASVQARACRRFLEQQGKGVDMSLEEVASDIARRDQADSTRAVSPLRKAEDAVEVDSSDLSLEDVVARILAIHGQG
ncbi:MAG TPA: (d)CMP kinase [Holophaga sp.]|nr:(d)CMP kinase [Holophaga sp.]